jgi:hypothetical protein
MAQLVSTALFKNIFKTLLESINNQSTNLYLFAGRGYPWDNEPTPDTEDLSIRKSSSDIRNDLLFGKKLSSDNFCFLVEKNSWEANTVYEIYDDLDPDLFSKKFFVYTTDRRVYKCLSNNNGNPSTVEPEFVDNFSVTLSDGYKWKYLYTVDEVKERDFSTDKLIPVVIDQSVINSTVAGTIDHILVTDGGLYNTYTDGLIRESISNTVFRIQSDASVISGFYNNCSLYITTGLGIGTLRDITNYTSNSSGNFVTLNQAANLNATSRYVISPKVVIEGNGEDFLGISNINTSNNSIQSITILNPGKEYTFASVSFQANTFHGSGAVARAIISPPGGHGFNAEEELYCRDISIFAKFIASEQGTIPANVTIRRLGLLINPQKFESSDEFTENTFGQVVSFRNTMNNTSLAFSIGELVYGQTSNSIGRIIRSSTNSSTVTTLKGSFIDTEEIIGQTSGISANISQVFTLSRINKDSGEILFYNNVEPFQRNNFSAESLKVVIKF